MEQKTAAAGSSRFEVRRDNRILARTDSSACIPDRKRRDELRRAGYKLFLDGKLWKEGKA